MKIELINNTKTKINKKKLLLFLNQIAKKVIPRSQTVNVVITTDAQIKKINKIYRKKDQVTDVISYCVNDDDFVSEHDNTYGEIFIAYNVAKKQARELDRSILQQIVFLFVHGLSHVLGYDHEKSTAEAAKMLKKEKELLKNANF